MVGKVPCLTHTLALIHTHAHARPYTHHKQGRLGDNLFQNELLATKMNKVSSDQITTMRKWRKIFKMS